MSAAPRIEPVIDGEYHDPGVDGPERPTLREQRFQLTGDARLQFWRETYLGCVQSLIAASPYLGDPSQMRALARMAATIADVALAEHLLRNDVNWPDSNVDLQRQVAKVETGG